MYNVQDCQSDIGNTGLQEFCGRKGRVVGLVLVRPGTEIATKLLALTKATWLDSINAEKDIRWLPIREIIDNAPEQEDPQFQDFDSGVSQFVRDGIKTDLYTIKQMTVYNKNQIMKNNGKDWDVYKIHETGLISGYTEDGTKFQPFATEYVRFLPEGEDTGAENGNVTVTIKYKDVRQHNDFQAVINPVKDTDAPENWNPVNTLFGIKDLLATVTNPTATGCTLTLKSYSGTAYSGAVNDDVYFAAAATTDTLIATTSITETSKAGVYDVVYASQTPADYLMGLKDQPDATTQGFETPTKDEFTIS